MDAEVQRIQSRDGTLIAVWVRGQGPPIVLVHGSMSDHGYLEGLAVDLASSMTVYSVDRRGFGASEDGVAYALDREFEDVAAVVDRANRNHGTPATLFGHSFGAGVAMGAATLTEAVGHLVLYEPGLGLNYPEGCIEEIETAVATGDPDRALSIIYTEILQMSAAELVDRRASPSWAQQLGTAHTVAREARVEESWRYEPDRFAAVKAPTLFIAGAMSGPDIATATASALQAIPGARLTTLEEHGHSACRTDPALVATAIRRFVLEP
ncbi:MAG TPA: alpha/beta hydrolase [Acidimicrobiia bacterium]|nr:alpha/beta hydrolase [Acidimicrobiia bacterium]